MRKQPFSGRVRAVRAHRSPLKGRSLRGPRLRKNVRYAADSESAVVPMSDRSGRRTGPRRGRDLEVDRGGCRLGYRRDAGAIVKAPHRTGEERDHIAELVRTTDPALLSVIEGLLEEVGIPHHVADGDMSVLEGSILVVQQRILVPDEREAEARALLVDADLGEWLRR